MELEGSTQPKEEKEGKAERRDEEEDNLDGEATVVCSDAEASDSSDAEASDSLEALLAAAECHTSDVAESSLVDPISLTESTPNGEEAVLTPPPRSLSRIQRDITQSSTELGQVAEARNRRVVASTPSPFLPMQSHPNADGRIALIAQQHGEEALREEAENEARHPSAHLKHLHMTWLNLPSPQKNMTPGPPKAPKAAEEEAIGHAKFIADNETGSERRCRELRKIFEAMHSSKIRTGNP